MDATAGVFVYAARVVRVRQARRAALPRLSLLQISDVHFGARLTGGKLGLTDALARARSIERREVFTRALELAIERNLDGVLLPGDLFDHESIDVDTLRFVTHALGSIAPKPVFLAPGNHDPYGGASPYRIEGDHDARGVRWPPNVHVFAHGDFRTVAWPGREDVLVTGCGVAVNERSTSRRLSARIDRPASPLSILLFHGSRDDGEFLQAHKSTYPFSRDELLAQQFTWTALGHYHAASFVLDDDGRVRAAYAGCPFAGGLDEQGEKGALVVYLEEHETHAEFVRLDPRRTFSVSCDLSGAGFGEQAVARALEALDRAGAGTRDLVRLELTGRRSRGLDLTLLDQVRERVHHLHISAADLWADVDLERYPSLDEAMTTEERFVAHLRDGHAGDHTPDLVHRALLYGLDALERGSIDTRYEE